MVSHGTEAPGQAARFMVAQDARWIADALQSTQRHRSGSGWLPLVLNGHSARIVYEGSAALLSPDPNVGVPPLAALLEDRFADVIARARHAGKLLDDTKKSYAQLREELGAFYAAHRQEFSGNAVRLARWLESDLGLFSAPGGKILGSTITGQFRLGVSSEAGLADLGPRLFEVAQEQGGALAVLSAAAGDTTPPLSTFDYAALGRMVGKDRKAAKYLAGRYDPVMSLETKLLLLMVEGEVNTTDVLLPLTESGHEEAVFRARVVSTFHALRAVEEVLASAPSAQSSGTGRVRALLSEPSTRQMLDDARARRVRNRCMHYEIRGGSVVLDPHQPMFGIVEALWPERSFEELNADVRAINARLAEALRLWRN